MNKLFEIQTLSERNTPVLRSYSRLRNGEQSVDPITLLLGGLPLINQLFPNIWGGGRKLLTSSDWLQIFPGSGYWTVKLRDYLKSHIHYDSDLNNITEYTRNFVYENRFTFNPSYPDGTNPRGFEGVFKIFSDKINAEKGGSAPGGNYPIISGGLDTTTLLLIGGGVLVFALLAKKKRRSRK